ncbi:hypothetical protein L484_013053 [Morus notabilis]|uniref:Uncharacterized protein n=1 Tax=Morus notabilis TaxID=981085 RepID=W9R9H8_9ROSA|nr:hypothetical protein L484_013053 [Morus notabilis]
MFRRSDTQMLRRLYARTLGYSDARMLRCLKLRRLDSRAFGHSNSRWDPCFVPFVAFNSQADDGVAIVFKQQFIQCKSSSKPKPKPEPKSVFDSNITTT